MARWDAVFSVMVAAAAAAMVHAQDARAADVPDFSGIWAHFTWPDFEPPVSGPGPVTNTSRRDGIPDSYQLVGDHSSPILKPKAAEIVKQHGGQVAGVGVIVDRSGGNRPDFGCPFVSLIQMQVETFPADQVPADLADIPAVKPGSR